MAKYEKFEKWMIGKKISVGDSQGVVLGRHFPSIVPSGVVCIQYKIGDGPTDWRWVELKCVTFLEEETSPIPWEVGQVVWDVVQGRGKVTGINHSQYPIVVRFDDGRGYDYYTKEGCCVAGHNRALFFSEPTIIADTMPPKKPFVPKLKEGEKILLKVPYLEEEKVAFVRREEENILYYMFEDGTKDYSGKSQITVTRIGEEIKFQ